MLVEAVFSIFITLLVVLILQNLMKTMVVANKANHKTDDIVFAYIQFNRFFKGKVTETSYVLPAKSSSNRACIVKVDKNDIQKTYFISYYNHMLRVTTQEGGHMPLLLDVKEASFITKDRQIKVDVTEGDGRKSEMYFKLDAKPSKEEDNDQQEENKR